VITTDGRRVRLLRCACGAPATVAIVIVHPVPGKRFGFCAVHYADVLARPDIVTSLVGSAEIVTDFTERRARQLAELPP
jgi:hypothetical protein